MNDPLHTPARDGTLNQTTDPHGPVPRAPLRDLEGLRPRCVGRCGRSPVVTLAACGPARRPLRRAFHNSAITDDDVTRTTTTVVAPTSAAPATTSSAPVATSSVVVRSTSSAPPLGRRRPVRHRGRSPHARPLRRLGTVTVLLIAGFGDGGDNWGSIEGPVAQDARVCSSARFGTGTSDPPATVQTFRSQAADLHQALGSIGEPGPYVVVGHSFGGAEAVTFASMFGDEVAGLLLLDASPTTWPETVCAVPDDGSDTARSYQQACARTPTRRTTRNVSTSPPRSPKWPRSLHSATSR